MDVDSRVLEMGNASFSDLEALVHSSSYIPVVNSVRGLLSMFDSAITDDSVKDVMLTFMSRSGVMRVKDVNTQRLFWLGAAGTVLSFVFGALSSNNSAPIDSSPQTSSSSSLVYLACIPFLLLAVGTGIKIAGNANRIQKVLGFCSLLVQLNDVLQTHADEMADTNSCLVAFDDKSEITSDISVFCDYMKRRKAVPFNGRVLFMFRSIQNAEDAAPSFNECANERGEKTFAFYRNIYSRIGSSRTIEELRAIQNELKERN